MGNIVLLDDLTINKIAAGEVIERPASVVKEMVENSIDAGSKNISVEIKEGGISFIQITDDGSGIAPDDMEIAFERHATSKIRHADDLSTVTTMGFRGEALASIAAIARVEMMSKKADSDVGYKIVIEGGKVLEKTEVGCPVGTTITVKNLFFNTPVRYRFLKKNYTEAGYIEEAVKRIALVNKDVSIKLINSGKTVIKTNGNGDFKTVVYSIFGKEIANSIIDVDYEYEDIKVSGVIGKPEISRANRQNQLFFINGRYVKDKSLTAAVDQCYRDIMPAGKFGFVVLNITMNPQKLDVNVHPAKLEVRFQDENAVFKAVYNAIKNGLGQPINIEKNENIKKEEIRPKEEVKLEINSGMTIEERVNMINSIINKIAPIPETQINKIEEVQEAPKTGNLIEDIYKSRNVSTTSQSQITEPDEKTIKYGNTMISSNTQEIDLGEISEKLFVTEKKEEPQEEIIEEHIETEKVQTFEENNENLVQNQMPQNLVDEENNVEDITEKNEFPNEKIEENKKDEFSEVVTEKLVEAKLNDIDQTQLIDSEKVKQTLVEEAYEENPEFEEMYKMTFGVDLNSHKEEKVQEEKNDETEKIDISNMESVQDINLSLFEKTEEYDNLNYKFVGVVFGTYIVIEIQDEMYMIDMQAAQERVTYEMIKHSYYNNLDDESQFLLLPDIVTLSEKELDIANENREIFAKIGFTFEQFGDNTIKLVSVPGICEKLNTKSLFLELLNKLNTVAVTAIKEKEEKILLTIAARVAEKSNLKLEINEIDSLMKQLLILPNPFTSPTGHSSAVKMTKYDLEKKFSRK